MKPSLLVRTFPVLVLSAAFLVGCGGGGASVESTTTTTTMGQELLDLDKAYKEGLLTDDQYKKSKKKIMQRYDN